LNQTILKSRPIDYWVLWMVAGLSLAINLWLVRTVIVARRQAAQAATTAAQTLSNLRGSAIDYTFHVQDLVPISVTVPVSTSVRVPISVTLPISTNVTVALRTPLGEIPLTFPVRTSVPVNLQPEVPIRASVPISISVPISLDVPVHLDLASTTLADSLDAAKRYLDDLATQLGAMPTTANPSPTPRN
jgi:hypothetical protein